MTPPYARTRRMDTLRIPPGSGYGDYLGPDSYAFEVIGNELSRKICAGDTIIVDPAKTPKPGGFIVTWPADTQGAPALHHLASPGKGADKAEPGATVHAVVAVCRKL